MEDHSIYPPHLLGVDEEAPQEQPSRDEPPPGEPTAVVDSGDTSDEADPPEADPAGTCASEKNPDEVGAEPCDEEGEPRKWWALYTRARQEKALGREMFRWEIPFYLPLIPKTRAYGRRRVHATIPLFAGYLFLYGTEAERVKSLTTNRVSRNLPVEDATQLVAELRNLKRLIDSGAPLTLESRLAAGAPVRIRRGPLMGVEGVVLKRHGNTRLLVSVNFLQKGASVAIEDFMLEPL
jgi:transcriptional antiterminator RfaH